MEEDTKEIKIPIKSIIEEAVYANGCKYDDEEFDILRKYFIAGLNLGFFEPNNLTEMVNKFCGKIKYISTIFNNINNLDYYLIRDNTLYLNDKLKETNNNFYEINVYKAATEVIFSVDYEHVGLANAICEIVAEKVYNMDETGSRIVLPKTNIEVIDGVTNKLRSGYVNYDIVITLLKQLLICKGINESRMIRRMYFEGYKVVIGELFNDDELKLVLSVLDKVFVLSVNRKINGTKNIGEQDLIVKYQIIVNNMFKKIDQNYYAFCALITTDDLREKCMKLIENR